MFEIFWVLFLFLLQGAQLLTAAKELSKLKVLTISKWVKHVFYSLRKCVRLMFLSHYREGWSQRACLQGNVWSWRQHWTQSRCVGGYGIPAELRHIKVLAFCWKTELSQQVNMLHTAPGFEFFQLSVCNESVCGYESEFKKQSEEAAHHRHDISHVVTWSDKTSYSL